MDNEMDKELIAEKKRIRIATADKAVIMIITALISVILLCVIFLAADFGPHNQAVESTAEKYGKAYIDFDYDTYSKLVFVDEEIYYTGKAMLNLTE